MMMNAIYLLHALVVLYFMKASSLGSQSLSKDGNVIMCTAREREALLLFRQGVANEYDLLDSWKKEEEEDCCKWKGVGCNNRTGHVTHLLLSSLILPSDTYTPGVSISMGNSLLDLPYLSYLDLSNNFLPGSRIPVFIYSLTKLIHLDLSNTETYGPIHEKIGNLSNLKYLNLSFNGFDGPIPKFVSSLNRLRYLDLSESGFTGVIPHELGNLSKLQYLALSSYSIHSIGYNFILKGGEYSKWLFNLSSLTYLDLSGGQIDPPSIWASFIQRIPSLSVMRLAHCNLSAPSSTISNFSSSISILQLGGNNIHSSIFNWLSHLSGSLVELDLSYNLLEGRIPESFSHMTALTHLDVCANQLTGVLLKSIYNLSSLQVADFSSNNFSGNLDDLLSGPFPLLQILSISGNKLTGSLPDITNHSSLVHLQVDSNQLDGYLPTIFKHQSALRFLDLSNNHLRGALPDFAGFSSLESLYLSQNEFSGSLPDFSGCSSLQMLQLGQNQLREWKSHTTGLPSSLSELDLSMNFIHDTISEAHLSNLSSIKYLRASFNSLTFEFSSEWLPPFQLWELSLASCNLGPNFPIWIRDQQHIGYLDISNNQISDTIPTWFWNFSSTLHHLNLSSNNIRGNFPFKFVQIQEIDLSSNLFDGPLPPISVQCLKINLSQNKFTGTLLSLSVVKGLPLGFLDISRNQLYGGLCDMWMHLQDLVFLNLGYNNFSGRIPMSIGNLVSLQTLILRKNKLYGDLPASLKNCSSLGFVDFGLNKLSGKVPSWFGKDLPNLYALILKSNRFYGSMPYDICHLLNLHFLDLSINRISGPIPPCFDNITAMIWKEIEAVEHIYSSSYSYNGPAGAPSASASAYSYLDNVLARWKGQEFEYGKNFAYLKMIDLSTNEFSGEIPIGITRLLELKGLNLSGNRFYGKIPVEIGQLKVLESLDLSSNKFSGEIPPSMSGLNFLSFLNLSNNNLSGKIPSGTQLQGFDISTYQGNTGLCGKPLTNVCPGNEPSDQIRPSIEYDVDRDNSEYKRGLYISAILGFSTTFWGIIGTLMLNSRWRRAYFMFLYDLKERFYVAMAVRIARFQRKV